MTRKQTWATSQANLLAEWEAFSGIWPRWGSLRYGEVFAQPEWAPRTVGPASSFSDAAATSSEAEYWPTARMEDSESTGAHRGALDTLTSRTEMWPTANAHDRNGARGAGYTMQDRHYKPHDLVLHVEQWRTPHMRDHHAQGPRADHPQRQLYLCDQTAQWPTPKNQAHDGKRGIDPRHGRILDEDAQTWMTPNTPNGGRKTSRETVQAKGSTPSGKRQVPLEAQAEFWPTPRTTDDQSGRGAIPSGETFYRPSEAFMAGRKIGQANLSDVSEIWPTPVRTDGAAAARSTTRTGVMHPGTSLSDAIKKWPTRASRDWKSEEGLPQSHMDAHAPTLSAFTRHQWKTPHGLQLLPGDPGGGGEFAKQAESFSHPALRIFDGLTFYERVRCLLPLCRRLRSSLHSPYNRARSIFRKKLNPNFTDWLQGLPPGFTSVEFDSRRMEIWLSLCRRRLALLNSPGGFN